MKDFEFDFEKMPNLETQERIATAVEEIANKDFGGDAGDWELLYELNDYVLGKNDYIMFDIDYQGYDIVAFQVTNFSYIGIVDRNYFDNDYFAPGEWDNFMDININFLKDSFILENNSSYNHHLNVKIWGVK